MNLNLNLRRCFKDFVDATAAEILSMMSSRPTRLRVKTRCAVRCPVFGKPSELAENVLPIYEQVMIYCAWVSVRIAGGLNPLPYLADPPTSGQNSTPGVEFQPPHLSFAEVGMLLDTLPSDA